MADGIAVPVPGSGNNNITVVVNLDQKEDKKKVVQYVTEYTNIVADVVAGVLLNEACPYEFAIGMGIGGMVGTYELLTKSAGPSQKTWLESESEIFGKGSLWGQVSLWASKFALFQTVKQTRVVPYLTVVSGARLGQEAAYIVGRRLTFDTPKKEGA